MKNIGIKSICVAIVLMAISLNIKMSTNSTGNGNLDLSLLIKTALAETESNQNGSGMFFYPNKDGDPKFCTLYRSVSASGSVSISETNEYEGEVGYTITTLSGLKERCPHNGDGCTVYSCQQTN